MATVMKQEARPNWLQWALWSDFAFYGTVGFLAAVSASETADRTGLDKNLLLILGISFVVLAPIAAYLVAQKWMLRELGWVAALGNWGAAVILVVLALTNGLSLTSEGNWTLGFIAVVAEILGTSQYIGLRRMAKEG